MANVYTASLQGMHPIWVCRDTLKRWSVYLVSRKQAQANVTHYLKQLLYNPELSHLRSPLAMALQLAVLRLYMDKTHAGSLGITDVGNGGNISTISSLVEQYGLAQCAEGYQGNLCTKCGDGYGTIKGGKCSLVSG